MEVIETISSLIVHDKDKTFLPTYIAIKPLPEPLNEIVITK
jgi:hypothetical protein